MKSSSLLVTTPKRCRETVVEYGKLVAGLMWYYCQLIKVQSIINGDSPYIRRKRQRTACGSILRDVINHGDPRAINELVIGELGEQFLTADQITA